MFWQLHVHYESREACRTSQTERMKIHSSLRGVKTQQLKCHLDMNLKKAPSHFNNAHRLMVPLIHAYATEYHSYSGTLLLVLLLLMNNVLWNIATRTRLCAGHRNAW